jgi:hypothetical protein
MEVEVRRKGVLRAMRELALMAAAPLVAGSLLSDVILSGTAWSSVLCSAVQTAIGNSSDSITLCKYSWRVRPL